MAKEKTKKPEKAEKETAPEFKFGVRDIAEKLGIKEASVRVQLRNKGIEKAGKSYGWNTKAEMQEVVDQLRSSDDEDEKPAKKTAKKEKAPAKKASSKKKAKDEDEDDDED